MFIPLAVEMSTPARPGTDIVASASSCSATSCRRPCAFPCSTLSMRTSEPGSHPSRADSHPQNSTPATADSGAWCTVTPVIRPSSSRHCGGSNVAATRSRQGVERSQARSTT
jgi:hypothetical protein